MHDDSPPWLRAVAQPGATVFALMTALEALARATLATVIPLQAYDLLQDARDVSLLNFAVSLGGLTASFTIPLLIRLIRRRWVYTMGVGLLVVTALLLATATLTGQATGMLARAFGSAATNITLSLYIMDYIRRRDFVHVEPRRLMFSAVTWAVGPFLGVWLYTNLGRGAAEALSGASAVALIVYFWYLRLQENPAVAAATKAPPNPIHSVGRFLAQPRLRLAWMITFIRSCWWTMLFVYPPLYMVQMERAGMVAAGEGKQLGALIVSAGNAVLILAPLFGRLAQRFGLRRPIIGAFVIAGSATGLAVLVYDFPFAFAFCLLIGAAFGTVVLDALGNIPFMRSVRPFERPQMTTVFRTYIDMSDLIPAAIFTVLLSFFDLRVVFIATAAWMFVGALIARKLPKSM
jgi:MFS family permease